MGVFTSLLEEVVHSMLSKIVSLACVALTAGQVQIEGSPEWQAYKNAELAHIAPSIGPLAGVGRNFAQEQLLHQQNALNFIASGAGRRKRQVPDWQANYAGSSDWTANFAGNSDWQANYAGNTDWQAYKNAELAFIAPSVGPTLVNHAQSALNFIAPSPGPTPVSFAQATLNYQQEALNFIASGLGK